MQRSTSGSKTNTLDLSLYTRTIWMRLAIILGLTIVYIAAFVFLVKLGNIGAALISLPVALAGLYFGINAGLIASFLGLALSVLLLAHFTGTSWITWMVNSWPGELMVIGVGYLSGRLRQEFFVRKNVLDELRLRDRYLTLINMTVRDILSPKTIEDRYHYLITHLVNLFVADYAYLIHWDAVREQAILVDTTIPLENPPVNILLQPDELELVVSVLRTGLVHFIEDVSNSHYVLTPSIFKNLPLSPHSALCIPLIVRDQKIGAAIIVYDTPHHFSDKEITYAEFAADQFALALWTIQQEFEIQKQLKVANTLVKYRTRFKRKRAGGITSSTSTDR